MKPGKIWLIFELNTGTHRKNQFGDKGKVLWCKADVPAFISVCENGLHRNCIDQESLFLISKVEFLMFFLYPFKIPDYLRTSSTGVRTSEKFRPLAPQDE